MSALCLLQVDTVFLSNQSSSLDQHLLNMTADILAVELQVCVASSCLFLQPVRQLLCLQHFQNVSPRVKQSIHSAALVGQADRLSDDIQEAVEASARTLRVNIFWTPSRPCRPPSKVRHLSITAFFWNHLAHQLLF